MARINRAEMIRRAFALMFLLCVSGCVSIPLSTIARLSGFDERDFAKLDAEMVRVKITLPEGFGLDAGKSWLGIEIQSSAGIHESTFELDEELKQDTEISGGIFSKAGPGAAYVLRLSVPSRAKFKELQGFVGRGRAEEINIRVVPKLSAFPKGAASVKVSVDLLLSKAQGYFTLLDAAEIPLDKHRAQN